ncbi:MAG: hypothetical protein ACREBU_23170 [Nitrososphaera sp.]
MHISDELERHPIFPMFMAKILAQVAGFSEQDTEVLETSVRLGRPISFDQDYYILGMV